MTQEIEFENELQPGGDNGAKVVPVADAIKYRRRAQQAETRLTEFEQKLDALQSQLEKQNDELEHARQNERQASSQLSEMNNRIRIDNALAKAGAIDLEAARLLLRERMDIAGELDDKQLRTAISEMLTAKPYLKSPNVSGGLMPSPTLASRIPQASEASQLAGLAQRAAGSGSRKDIAEYLRLRRQISTIA